MGDDLPPLTNLPLNPPSGDTGPIDLTEYTEVKSGVLEANQVYVAKRQSKGCGYVQVQFKCVRPYAFNAGEVGNEVRIISIYTSTDSPTGGCVYRKGLPVGESAYFHWPYFMFTDGNLKFGHRTTWKLYTL